MRHPREESHLRLLHGGVPAGRHVLFYRHHARRTAARDASRRGRSRQHLYHTVAHPPARWLPDLSCRGPLQQCRRGAPCHSAQQDLRLHLHPEGNDRGNALGTTAEDIILLQQHLADGRSAALPRPQDHQHLRLCRRRAGNDAGSRCHSQADGYFPATHRCRSASAEQPVGQLQRLPQHDAHPRHPDALHLPHHSLQHRNRTEVQDQYRAHADGEG